VSSAVHLLLGHPEVDLFIDAHDLRSAEVELETIMLRDDDDGRPCVLFALRLDDGSRVLASVTYRVLQTALAGMTGALQRRRANEPPSSSCGAARQLRAIYPCGCSHHKVELGMCDVYAPDGTVRS
jgi:hypothetical protein